MFELSQLTLDAYIKLRSAMCGDDDYFIKAIKDKECQLWRTVSDTYIITRVENINGFRVLVVCCYSFGSVQMREFFNHLITICKSVKIGAIRIHTLNDKVKNFLKRYYKFKDAGIDNNGAAIISRMI